MKKLTNQNKQVLVLLRHVGSEGLTPLEAQYRIGTMRLAARIYDLKQLGWKIETLWAKTASGTKVARYVLQ
jgi:hypothetical protein